MYADPATNDAYNNMLLAAMQFMAQSVADDAGCQTSLMSDRPECAIAMDWTTKELLLKGYVERRRRCYYGCGLLLLRPPRLLSR